MGKRTICMLMFLGLLLPQIAWAQALTSEDGITDDGSNVFRLGQITVVGEQENEAIATTTVTKTQMEDFGKDDVLGALSLIPGVAVQPGTGARNEGNFRIRGFDSWRVPLMMDGMRLYLPYDNRIDIGRFLTPDLSEIQVSKGYVSVLNGPGGMGGAINLVTRKPVKEFEAEARVTMLMGGEGQYNGMTYYGNVGGKMENWYWQGSYENRDIDHWRLSENFHSTPYEDGGKRVRSDSDDWRMNLKAGFTPNDTDEYSLNFVKQEGTKTGSFNTIANTNDWVWPQWDVWNLYWLSHTEFTDDLYLNTKAYYNQFDNKLQMNNFATNNLSTYDDTSYGVSLEAGTTYIPMNTLKVAFHYRRDDHTEWNKTISTGDKEPKQDAKEDTWSFAVEDTLHVTSDLDLVGGVSYDYRNTIKVEDYASGRLFKYKTDNTDAWNFQGAVIYRYDDTGKVNFSVSHRTSMPTLFHRFSSRMGTATSNPNLKPEKALNLELAVSDRLFENWNVEAAVFYNRIDDLMQGVRIGTGSRDIQNQNIGKGTFVGFELAVDGKITPELEVGANYTYTNVNIDISSRADNSTLERTGIPRHAGMVYAKWQPLPELSFIPYVEWETNRTVSNEVSGRPNQRVGARALVNFKVGYELNEYLDFSITARNLLDKNYELSHGYPMEGRNFLLTARFRY